LPLSARLLLLLVLAGAVPLGASPLWTLTWADEGDGAANSLPDSTKWRMEQGGGGWGNSELQTYTNRSQNARYDGAGNLVLEARQEGYTGPDGIYLPQTSSASLIAPRLHTSRSRRNCSTLHSNMNPAASPGNAATVATCR
jgi:hypothetical protein